MDSPSDFAGATRAFITCLERHASCSPGHVVVIPEWQEDLNEVAARSLVAAGYVPGEPEDGLHVYTLPAVHRCRPVGK